LQSIFILLYNRVMNKETYWKGLTTQEKQELADYAGVHYNSLSSVFNGKREASPNLIEKITQYSEGALTKCDIRPDLYPEDVFCKK